jgi:hypothetical protein
MLQRTYRREREEGKIGAEKQCIARTGMIDELAHR